MPLLEQASRRADTLSGGQQQRAAVARAMVADAPVEALDDRCLSRIYENVGAAVTSAIDAMV